MSKLLPFLMACVMAVLAVSIAGAAPLAQEPALTGGSLPLIWWFTPLGAIIALMTAALLYRSIMQRDEGTDLMKEIAQAVREGAMAYLKRQYRIVGIVFAVLFVLFLFMGALGLQSLIVPFAFLTGGILSAVCGYIGMRTATNASARTAHAASKSLNDGLQVAFRAGAVMGLTVVGFALLDTSFWFLLLYVAGLPLDHLTVILVSASMGASTQALFARVGGGIYTKAADVGADLVGKVEAGIPEDDPRNPATIADNVGDNVGDVAGMGADLYESYLGSLRAAMALGVAAIMTETNRDPNFGHGISTLQLQLNYLAAPMVISGFGAIFSIIGIFLVRTTEKASMGQIMSALTRSINLSSLLIALMSYPILMWLGLPWTFWISTLTGLAVGIIIGYVTEYYTSDEYGPTQYIIKQADTGPATVIIAGLAVGFRSTAIPVLVIMVGIVISFYVPGGANNALMGLYGVALASVSMLSTLGITLATDAYGPIADNAGGNAEMAKLPHEVRERTDQLDAVGNTTAATGKGFAIGSAALTALALLASYMEQVRFSLQSSGVNEIMINKNSLVGFQENVPVATATLKQFFEFYNVTLLNPATLLGVFAGAVTVFYFAALTLDAVGRAASAMVQEVRRQFKEKPGILAGTEKPDYARCVEISTAGAQREMIVPSLLAIVTPVLVGVIFGVAGVMGLLTGSLTTGFVLAVLMANAGGAWDNAKKSMEKEGKKGSDPHKATVVGDTVGDPFKDTTGPSLNILIKLMSMVAIVFAGFINWFDQGFGLIGLLMGR